MQGRLFVFSGIDGAGKSTQIERVACQIVKSGHVPFVLWARGGYTTGMNLLKGILRLGNSRLPSPGPSAARSHAFTNPWVRKCWLRLAVLDLIRVYGFVLRWRLWRGRVVLCDRYWQDTLLDFQLHFPEENVAGWRLWRALRRVCPQPHATFLMRVPLNVSLERSEQKQEPFPTPADVLEIRLQAYDEWSKQETCHLLDGQRSRNELTAEIMKIVEPRVAGCGSQRRVSCLS